MHISYQQHHEPFIIFEDNYLLEIPHLHFHIEMIYVENGSFTINQINKEIELKSGDFYISFSNTPHFYVKRPDCPDDKDIKVTIMLFDPVLLSDYQYILTNKSPIYPIITKDKLHKDVIYAMKEMLKLSDEGDATDRQGSVFLLRKAFFQLILARTIPMLELVEGPSQTTNDIATSVITYLVENYRKPITLDSLSRKMGISKYHLSRTINEKLHIGFSQYLNSLRINLAKEMLITSDMLVSHVGEYCGYETHRTFNREFKKSTGMNPREFRDKFQKHVI